MQVGDRISASIASGSAIPHSFACPLTRPGPLLLSLLILLSGFELGCEEELARRNEPRCGAAFLASDDATNSIGG